MALPTARVKAHAALRKARVLTIEDPLKAPENVRLTERFLQLRRELSMDAVQAVVAMGEIARRIKSSCQGHYRRWLKAVGVSRSTGIRYERLSVLAERFPQLVETWKGLGPTKLYRLAELNEEGRREIIHSGPPDRLLNMSEHEFEDLTAPFVNRPRKVTADMKAHGFRMKIRAWIQATKDAGVREIRSPAVREELRRDLLALSRILRDKASFLRRHTT